MYKNDGAVGWVRDARDCCAMRAMQFFIFADAIDYTGDVGRKSGKSRPTARRGSARRLYSVCIFLRCIYVQGQEKALEAAVGRGGPRAPAAQISSSEDDNDEAWETRPTTSCFRAASRLALPEKWEALAKEVQRIAASGEHGLEMRPL